MNDITKCNILYLIKLCEIQCKENRILLAPGMKDGGQLVYRKCEYEQGTQKSNHVLQIYTSEG